MAINPPDLAFGIQQIATGVQPNDGLGDPIKTAFEKVNFDLTVIAAQLIGLSSGLNTSGTEITSLLDRVTDIETDVSGLQAQQVINTADINGLETSVNALQSAVNSSVARLNTAELNITNLQTAVSNLQTSVGSLQNAIDDLAPIDSPVFTTAASLANNAIPPSNNNSNRIPSTSWVVAYTQSLSGDGFPTGTGLLFYQSTAPAGWNLANNVDDYALRVDNDNAGQREPSGKTFNEAFRTTISTGQRAVTVSTASGINTTNATVTVNNRTGLSTNPHVLTVGQIPSHSHGVGYSNGDDDNGNRYADSGELDQFRGYFQTQDTGGGQGHSHTIQNHNHTTVAHNHTLQAHSHVSPIHDHDVNINVRYANVMICIKA